MSKELVFFGPKKVGFREYTEKALKDDEVKLKSLMSGISHGTEMNYYRDNVPFFKKKWNQDFRLFVKGESTWSYPTTVGYENVSVVTDVGKEVKNLKKGDRVWVFKPHRETNVVSEHEARSGLIPKGVSQKEGIFTMLAKVALGAVHDAKIKIGDNVAIFGLGTIGLMVAQLAKLCGAEKVYAVDLITKRLKKAEEYNVQILNARENDVALKIKENSFGKGVDVAIETSGSYRGVHEAIRSCSIAGRVVTVGFYRGGASNLYLGEEWHHNRITLLSSMTSWDCPHRDFPLWNEDRLLSTVFKLFKDKKLLVEDLITHIIPFENAQKAYELIDKNPQKTIKVALSYAF
jgi:2-desacetyl-2-hydroxyethyl bacteriochlorophyllide A dehydrogenase